MTQRSISNTRGRCSTRWRDSALQPTICPASSIPVEHLVARQPAARGRPARWRGFPGSRSHALTARFAAFSASPFARWAGRFQPRSIIRRLASTVSGCLCSRCAVIQCQDGYVNDMQRFGTVIEIFEMRDRTKVRCDDEIAGGEARG